MAGRTYRVSIVRGDYHFEAEGDKPFVLAMLKRFDVVGGTPAEHASVEGASDRASSQLVTGDKSLSPGEFIRQLGFKRHTDIVLAFGYYLEHVHGVRDFTPADINNVYYDAKMENSNTSQMCINNVRKGFMMESKGASKGGGKKRFTVTNSGEQHVEKRLAKQPA